jgi:hypothetical protein
VISAVGTLVMNALGVRPPADQTRPEDYHGGPETG